MTETAWSLQEQRNGADYLNHLDQWLLHFDMLKVNYARLNQILPDNRMLEIRLPCIHLDMEICYMEKTENR